MTVPAMILAALTGFQVTWSVQPARGEADGSISLEVTLDEEDLLFVRGDGAETASYEVMAVLDGSVASRTDGTVYMGELPVTEDVSIGDVGIGRHTLAVIAGDLESGRRFSWRDDIEVPLIDSASWSSSGLQVPGGEYLRAEGTTEVVWNVYPPASAVDSQPPLRAAFVLRDGRGVVQREDWMQATEEDDRFTFTAEVDLGGMGAGEYELLGAAVREGAVVAAASKELDLLQAWDVWGQDPEMTRSLVRPIASSSELSALDDAGGPASRAAVMAEFWERRDPTPGTVRNEFLLEYLSRLDHIEESFSVLNTLGINTDRGRVYALLGEPDIVDEEPLSTTTRPTVVWTYFTPPLEVLFVDYVGVGQYELSTDWEEVRDAWEN